MSRLLTAALVLAFVGLSTNVRAADDPTGTWKWTIRMGDQSREVTLKLKLEGDKLTGAMAGREGQPDTPIAEGKFKDGELSFKVTRERQGQKMTTKYSGKLAGDTIKGKMEFEREGKTNSRDWEAKRAK